MRVLALLLALSLPAAAQEVVDVRSATLTDAVGRVRVVEGGVWVDDAQTMAAARELARLEGEVADLRAAPPLPPVWTLGVALVLGLGAGLAIGLAGR